MMITYLAQQTKTENCCGPGPHRNGNSHSRPVYVYLSPLNRQYTTQHYNARKKTKTGKGHSKPAIRSHYTKNVPQVKCKNI